MKFTDQLQFTDHNIRLDDGTFTEPEFTRSMVDYPWFISARGILETVFPGDKNDFRLADVGCLEGGYAVEFARMGFRVLGIEVRELNIAACNYVKSKTDLPHLEFVQDDALNIARHGVFDAVFCCGLLYHLDRPKQYLETLSSVTNKLLFCRHISRLLIRAIGNFNCPGRCKRYRQGCERYRPGCWESPSP